VIIPKPARFKNEALLERIRQMPCIVCGAPGPSDPSHIKSRGAGGGDTEHNCVPMCRDCHCEWGRKGWYTFLGQHIAFADWLLDHGWDIDVFNRKLSHP
jgi:hypothetical protein